MSGSSNTVLVIDDDRLTRRLLTDQLERGGFSVFEAPNGIDGLETTYRQRPDCVLCDWIMPEMDGPEFCRRVKSDPTIRSTHVALLTSRDDTGTKVAGLDAGADDFLVKPVPDSELLARVRAALRHRDREQEVARAERQAALREMAATLGHEINNPLTALFGHLELLVQYIESGDRTRMMHHVRSAGAVADRIAKVGQRLVSLNEPKTVPYLDEQRMLDLDGSEEP